MRIDQAGIDLLVQDEGLELTSYLDTGGVWTLGIGSTRFFGKPVTRGMKCTEEEAYEQCRRDVRDSEDAVTRLVKVPLTQNQFNSLVNFVYNIGEGAFEKSTLLKVLNKGDYAGTAKQFMRWIYDNGKRIEGLKKRRQRTVAMFNS